MAHPFQTGLQDATSPIMGELLHFHDHTLMIVFLISTLVLSVISSMLTTKLTHTDAMDAQEVKTVWTILPAIILILIALPSLRLLYMMDEINNPSLTVKTMGHQWYWSCEYTDYKDLDFDSDVIPTQELKPGELRLLEVGNRVVLPMEMTIRMLISSEDVLRSWAMPSLGLKTDAIPGRLNQTTLMAMRSVINGQCSEICASNHSFMPIVLELVPYSHFGEWSISLLEIH